MLASPVSDRLVLALFGCPRPACSPPAGSLLFPMCPCCTQLHVLTNPGCAAHRPLLPAGRKIIIDTYGGWGAHGGGAFSGKVRSLHTNAAPTAWCITAHGGRTRPLELLETPWERWLTNLSATPLPPLCYPQDPTKVDRSGAYIARQAAKSVVAAGLARRCLVQVRSAALLRHAALPRRGA